MLDAEDFELLLVEADTAEHQSVAAQRFNGVDTHAAHHFADFMAPCRKEVFQSFTADIRIQTLYQLRTLGCNAPVALALLAGAAQMAATRPPAL